MSNQFPAEFGVGLLPVEFRVGLIPVIPAHRHHFLPKSPEISESIAGCHDDLVSDLINIKQGRGSSII